MVALFSCFVIGEINNWAPLTHFVNIPHAAMMTQALRVHNFSRNRPFVP